MLFIKVKVTTCEDVYGKTSSFICIRKYKHFLIHLKAKAWYEPSILDDSLFLEFNKLNCIERRV